MDLKLLTIIIIYIIIVLFIAIITSRKTSEEYLIANRNLGYISSSFSIIASKVNGGTILVGIAYIYTFGISAMSLFIGAAIGYVLFLIFSIKELKPLESKHKFYTLFDYLSYKFSFEKAKPLSFLLFLGNIIIFLIQIIGGAKILEYAFNINYNIGVLIITSIISIYIVAGGFRSVVFTDILQTTLFLTFIGIIASQIQKYVFITPNFDPLNITYVILFFLAGMISPFGHHDIWQRVYATKKSALKKSFITTILLYSLFGFFLISIGIATKSIFPGIEPETALLEVIRSLLEGPILYVAVLALFSIIMSSADTFLFNSTGILLQDILKVNKNLKTKYMKLLIILSLIICITAILFKNIMDLTFIYTGIFAFIGSSIMFSWLFKLNSERISKTFKFNSIIFIISAVIILGPNVFIIAVLLPLISYLGLFLKDKFLTI